MVAADIETRQPGQAAQGCGQAPGEGEALRIELQPGHPRRVSRYGDTLPRVHSGRGIPVQARRPAQIILEPQQCGAVRHQAVQGAGEPAHGRARTGTGRDLGEGTIGQEQREQHERAEQRAGAAHPAPSGGWGKYHKV